MRVVNFFYLVCGLIVLKKMYVMNDWNVKG